MRRVLLFALAFVLFSAVALGASGDLDPSWGRNGVTRTLLERGQSRQVITYAVALTPRGQVLVHGIAGLPETAQPFLARYTSRGRLDRGFGSGGLLRGNRVAGPVGLTLPNGKTILLGEAVRRLHRNGRLDRSFGVGGYARLRVDRCWHFARRAVRLPNGKLVLAVETCRAERLYDNTYALMRLHADGRIDRAFGRRGVATARVGEPWGLTFSTVLARQADGKLLLAGRAYRDRSEAFALVRFRADGRLDRSFGRGGMVLAPASAGPYVEGLFVQPDGKLLVAGCTVEGTEQPDETMILRYLQNGSLDPTWGTGGVRSYGDLGVASRARECASFAMSSRQRVVVLGDRLWRLDRDGTVDSSFGSSGSIDPGRAEALAVQPDDKIVAAGGLRLRPRQHGLDVRRYHG